MLLQLQSTVLLIVKLVIFFQDLIKQTITQLESGVLSKKKKRFASISKLILIVRKKKC